MTPTTALSSDTLELLSTNQGRKELVDYLRHLEVTCGTLTREQVVTILGQWFHPLHYFPVFLSRVISVAPEVVGQTFISRILWQELGEGDPLRAHERIYLETILDGDFSAQQVSEAPPFEATRKLVAGYQAASQDYLSGLGFLYGTEVVDLQMVSTIGELMRRCTGKQVLPWVDVHIQQEPDHVNSSNETLRPSFTEQERQQIVESAEKMWSLWTNFFKSLSSEILN